MLGRRRWFSTYEPGSWGNLTFDEIKAAALRLPDDQRAELLAILIAAQVDARAADNLGQGDS